MVRNLLAAIGLVVVARKACDFYRHYNELKEENERLREAAR